MPKVFLTLSWSGRRLDGQGRVVEVDTGCLILVLRLELGLGVSVELEDEKVRCTHIACSGAIVSRLSLDVEGDTVWSLGFDLETGLTESE